MCDFALDLDFDDGGPATRVVRMDDDVVERPTLACALQLDPIDHHAGQAARLARRQHREQVGCADLRLKIRARWSARRGLTPRGSATFVTQQPAPSDRLFPRRVAAPSDAPYETFGTELSQRTSDRGATDRWQSALKIGVSKLVRQSADDVANHVPLRAALGACRTYTILELSIRLHQHHADEVLPPGNKRVLAFMPVLRRSLQRGWL